jgi:hypothetical protein
MQNPQKPFSESGTSPPRRLTLRGIRWNPGCTFVFAWGDDDSGRGVLFSGDFRTMLSLGDMLDLGIPVEVWICGCEVLAYRRAGR